MPITLAAYLGRETAYRSNYAKWLKTLRTLRVQWVVIARTRGYILANRTTKWVYSLSREIGVAVVESNVEQCSVASRQGACRRSDVTEEEYVTVVM